MNRKVLVPIADGSEELEAIGIIDTLRRAGAEVTVASVTELEITGSHGIHLVADTLIEDCRINEFDLIVLPGGIPGAEYLRDNKYLAEMLKKQAEQGKFYSAICASPVVVLHHHGLLKDKTATAHPGFSDSLENQQNVSNRVVVDGNCITSQGPGTVLEFSLKLIELLYGKEKADQVGSSMLIKWI